MYDLNLTPISIENGQQHARLIGFQAAKPPRRAARSRADDMLILFFTTSEKERISGELVQTWLDDLTDMFYKTSGSVTSDLRSLVERMNQILMERNFTSSPKSRTMSGAINAAALHHDYLYLAQSGQTHAFMLTQQGLQHFYDSSHSDRGLGLSRTPAIRYFQADIGSGSYLFMTDNPPSTWREDLLFSNGYPNPEQLKRRLLNQTPSNFEMGLIQVEQGNGNIVTVQAGFAQNISVEIAKEDGKDKEPEPFTVKQDQVEVPVFSRLSETQQVQKQPDEEMDAGQDDVDLPLASISEKEPQPDTQAIPVRPIKSKVDKPVEAGPDQQAPTPNLYRTQTIKTSEVKPKKAHKEQKSQALEKGLRGMASFFDGWHRIRQRIDTFFRDLIARWSPEDQEGPPQLSRKTKLWIAVVVPIIVVAIAAGIYIGRGRTLQYESYFGLAQVEAQDAINASDPNLARQAWWNALDYIGQAETYKQTNETTALKEQAQDALDALDGAIRLRYHSALVDSLPENVNITRIIYYGADLYLLDSYAGGVIHALGTGQGYKVQDDMICQAGNYSGGNIGALIDMVSLPPNNPYQAHILGLDGSGNVVYCAPGLAPVVQSLPSAGETQSTAVRAAYESNTLYVLDRDANTINVFSSTNGQFIDLPVDYFGASEPGEKPDLSSVTDLEVNGSKLYLLKSSGSIVECVYSGLPGDLVNCQDPVTYNDGRTGGEDQPVSIPESNFVSILYNPPPVSTISILDANTADIYRFSQIFRLNRQLRPDMGDAELLNPTATAFTIGMERVIFLAFGNQVFFAYVE